MIQVLDWLRDLFSEQLDEDREGKPLLAVVQSEVRPRVPKAYILASVSAVRRIPWQEHKLPHIKIKPDKRKPP